MLSKGAHRELEFEGIGSEWHDANVLVKREKVKNLSSRQLVGSHQKSSFTYEITVRKKKAQPITIVIEDQIPVPNTKEIDVEKIEDSKAEYKEETGFVEMEKGNSARQNPSNFSMRSDIPSRQI
ncbi:MAG: DUF4139 domain-containing protein [Cytophagales bacterium]